jgi:anti-anti-sigma factor
LREELYLMHTLVLLGELDGASAPTLEAAVEELCKTKTAQITFDLSKLSHIDATGVAVLAFRCGWCERQGRTVALVPGTRRVQRAFELANVAHRLPFLQPQAGAPAMATVGLTAEGAPSSAGVQEPDDSPLECEESVAVRSHSITLPLAPSRRRRARRARLAGGGL